MKKKRISYYCCGELRYKLVDIGAKDIGECTCEVCGSVCKPTLNG